LDASEQSRELADHATTCHEIEARPIRALPQAPALAPLLEISEEADAPSNTPLDDRGKEIVKALEAIPGGSKITFASDNLWLAGDPIIRGTEAYRQVAHLAEACNCSISVREKAGTITFSRNEIEPSPCDMIGACELKPVSERNEPDKHPAQTGAQSSPSVDKDSLPLKTRHLA
jgi:hypothetical protein